MDKIVVKMQIRDAGMEELTNAGVSSSKMQAGDSFSFVNKDKVETFVALEIGRAHV